MAVLSIVGFELGNIANEPSTTQASANRPTVTGNATLESTIVHTGGGALKCAPASGAAGSWDSRLSSLVGIKFYIRVTARPATTARGILGAGTGLQIRIGSDGKLDLALNGARIAGPSTTALTDTSRWYLIQYLSTLGTIYIDGSQQVQEGSLRAMSGILGASDTVADTYTAYFDDLVLDDANLPPAGKVVLLLPASDSTIGSWTKPGGGTTGLNTSVDNQPPVGIADTTLIASAENQIRNPTANDNYVVNMATYASAGIGASDTINAVRVFCETGAPTSTGAKTGSIQITSNPAEAGAFSFTNFYSGANAATYPTGWKANKKTPTETPTVTIASAPVVTLAISGGTTSRIAMCCFIGIYVDYTPVVISTPVGAAFSARQAVSRAANF